MVLAAVVELDTSLQYNSLFIKMSLFFNSTHSNWSTVKKALSGVNIHKLLLLVVIILLIFLSTKINPQHVNCLCNIFIVFTVCMWQLDATDVLSALGAIPAGFGTSHLTKLLEEEGQYTLSNKHTKHTHSHEARYAYILFLSTTTTMCQSVLVPVLLTKYCTLHNAKH